MEIVIENPGEIMLPRNNQHVVPSPEYFASLANQRLLTGAEVNGSTPVRRVDRSGLLEMPLNKQHPETILRRIDRSGLLESVSEVPDHVAYAKSRLLEERHLTGAELSHDNNGPSSLTLPRYRCRERRGSHDPSAQNLEKKESSSSPGCFGTISRASITDCKGVTGLNHVEQMVARFSPSRSVPTPNPDSGVERFRTKTKLELGIGRLSPRPKNDHRVSSSPAALSIPDVIEGHEAPSVTQSSITANNDNNSRTNSGDNNDDINNSASPEGERAEAEGCEHTAIESLEEARVSFQKAQKNISHNSTDNNIQTLRVIILSEQL